MSPEGYDTLLLFTGDTRLRIHAVMKWITVIWPRALFVHGSRTLPQAEFSADRIPGFDSLFEEGFILAVRDEEMSRSRDATGGTAGPDGHGPLALWYSKLAPMARHIDVASSDQEPCLYGRVELVVPDLAMLTVTTPESPEHPGFSADVIAAVRNVMLA